MNLTAIIVTILKFVSIWMLFIFPLSHGPREIYNLALKGRKMSEVKVIMGDVIIGRSHDTKCALNQHRWAEKPVKSSFFFQLRMKNVVEPSKIRRQFSSLSRMLKHAT